MRRLTLWNAQHPRYNRLREYCKSDRLKQDYPELLPKLNDEEICNMAITLINQATYLLRRLMERQQKDFLENGGIREQMTRARIAHRSKKQ